MPGEAEARELERKAVAQAEEGDLDGAEATLLAAADACPGRGSVWNNVAQVRRMRKDPEGALEAACKAIELEQAWLEDHKESFKGSRAWDAHRDAVCKALTQRAAIHKAAGRDEEAERDLGAAAAKGSPLARALTSGSNPYATMCHAAVASMTEGAGKAGAEGGDAE